MGGLKQDWARECIDRHSLKQGRGDGDAKKGASMWWSLSGRRRGA